ncbi:collagen alpha-1(I) chain-like [Canis lupus familiaris]|uniref:collagen alpha-1(I) chain-like n=1 Tax=Canis lupus familiaris TaxID=9615 RepID=UPI0018F5909D|nr:collagen alpha-1(I) chain-like [Canis lupus familiaris]
MEKSKVRTMSPQVGFVKMTELKNDKDPGKAEKPMIHLNFLGPDTSRGRDRARAAAELTGSERGAGLAQPDMGHRPRPPRQPGLPAQTRGTCREGTPHPTWGNCSCDDTEPMEGSRDVTPLPPGPVLADLTQGSLQSVSAASLWLLSETCHTGLHPLHSHPPTGHDDPGNRSTLSRSKAPKLAPGPQGKINLPGGETGPSGAASLVPCSLHSTRPRGAAVGHLQEPHCPSLAAGWPSLAGPSPRSSHVPHRHEDPARWAPQSPAPTAGEVAAGGGGRPSARSPRARTPRPQCRRHGGLHRSSWRHRGGCASQGSPGAPATAGRRVQQRTGRLRPAARARCRLGELVAEITAHWVLTLGLEPEMRAGPALEEPQQQGGPRAAKEAASMRRTNKAMAGAESLLPTKGLLRPKPGGREHSAVGGWTPSGTCRSGCSAWERAANPCDPKSLFPLPSTEQEVAVQTPRQDQPRWVQPVARTFREHGESAGFGRDCCCLRTPSSTPQGPRGTLSRPVTTYQPNPTGWHRPGSPQLGSSVQRALERRWGRVGVRTAGAPRGGPRRPKEAQGGPRRPEEAQGGSRRPKEARGGPRGKSPAGGRKPPEPPAARWKDPGEGGAAEASRMGSCQSELLCKAGQGLATTPLGAQDHLPGAQGTFSPAENSFVDISVHSPHPLCLRAEAHEGCWAGEGAGLLHPVTQGPPARGQQCRQEARGRAGQSKASPGILEGTCGVPRPSRRPGLPKSLRTRDPAWAGWAPMTQSPERTRTPPGPALGLPWACPCRGCCTAET